jgi:hypothetical protein
MVNRVGDGCGNAHDADFTQALNTKAIDQRVRLFHASLETAALIVFRS